MSIADHHGQQYEAYFALGDSHWNYCCSNPSEGSSSGCHMFFRYHSWRLCLSGLKPSQFGRTCGVLSYPGAIHKGLLLHQSSWSLQKINHASKPFRTLTEAEPSQQGVPAADGTVPGSTVGLVRSLATFTLFACCPHMYGKTSDTLCSICMLPTYAL